jgi:glucose/arabinose dehydrogenase
VLVAAVALAGCGGGDGGSTASTTSSTSTTTSAGTTTTTTTGGGGLAVGDGQGGVELEKLGSFDQPVYVTQPEGDPDHLYVVEQCGTIARVPVDGGEPSTFLDISNLVTCGGEQGLLSMAFAPDYADSGRLYVNYTGLDGDSRTVEYRRSGDDPGTADPGSARELVRIQDFAPNHNGGLLLFGPDGELYLGMGDGGGAGDPERTAQNPDSPLGKLLRVDVDHPGASPEVAALGLRNPWRFSFDRSTDALWIGDVGQDTFEEIDALPPGEIDSAGTPPNFGWSAFEGTNRFNSDQQAPDAIRPVLEYGRDRGCSVTGGYVVRDRELTSLYGRYLYGDFCQGELRSFTADPDREASDDRPVGLEVPNLSSFGEDTSGRVYAVSLSGPVYRLIPAG